MPLCRTSRGNRPDEISEQNQSTVRTPHGRSRCRLLFEVRASCGRNIPDLASRNRETTAETRSAYWRSPFRRYAITHNPPPDGGFSQLLTLGVAWSATPAVSCVVHVTFGEALSVSSVVKVLRPSSARCLVLDQLDGVAGVVADERKPLGRCVAHVERHLDAFGFQLREDSRQVLHLEAEVLHAVGPEVL